MNIKLPSNCSGLHVEFIRLDGLNKNGSMQQHINVSKKRYMYQGESGIRELREVRVSNDYLRCTVEINCRNSKYDVMGIYSVCHRNKTATNNCIDDSQSFSCFDDNK